MGFIPGLVHQIIYSELRLQHPLREKIDQCTDLW